MDVYDRGNPPLVARQRAVVKIHPAKMTSSELFRFHSNQYKVEIRCPLTSGMLIFKGLKTSLKTDQFSLDANSVGFVINSTTGDVTTSGTTPRLLPVGSETLLTIRARDVSGSEAETQLLVAIENVVTMLGKPLILSTPENNKEVSSSLIKSSTS